MERLAQYIDNFEDLFYAAALKAERIRQALQFLLFMAASVTLQILGVLIALRNPPMAVAVVALLVVGLIFRAVIGVSPEACAVN